MRKYFILLLLSISLSVYSQNEREHLSFLGVPMIGSLDNFVEKVCSEKKLEKQGDKKFDNGLPYYHMIGTFWKFQGCDIGIYGNDNNEVYKAIVSVFDISLYESFLNLEDLVDNYDLKYGTHKIEYDGDTKILIWETKGGIIKYRRLIIPDILNALRIDYIDCDIEQIKQNNEKEKIKELEDL